MRSGSLTYRLRVCRCRLDSSGRLSGHRLWCSLDKVVEETGLDISRFLVGGSDLFFWFLIFVAREEPSLR